MTTAVSARKFVSSFASLTVLAAMRSDPRLRDTPAIIFSSSTADRDRERALRSGATRYWVKPSRFRDLVAQVATLLPLLG